MDILSVIKQRRSVRNFKTDKVSRKELLKLIEAGIWAPSGSNIQPWHFVIVDDKDFLNKINAVSPGLYGSPPALIVICYDKKLSYDKGGRLGKEVLGLMDVSIAAQNIMLLATSIGMATCPVKSFNKNALKKILNIPEKIEPELIVSVGYAEIEPQAPERHSIKDVVCFNNWGRVNDE